MKTIAVIGLGYVGLPLAVEFSKKYSTIGFDINERRIDELLVGFDRTHEVHTEDLRKAKQIKFTYKPDDLQNAQIFIITVPTPVTMNKTPDLRPLELATQMVARFVKRGGIVIYESTVFPGCTEEFCVPILEKISGLKFNRDFFCGYSPERLNPGDKEHTITKIMKVTSGSTLEIAQEVNELYASIITAGTFQAESIKIAEAAKVIENTQRDINIAFVNELSLIFERMGIDTNKVLDAARTKWNFLDFRPGLVGGHCIGVDPYYLTHKAEELGYHPQVILAGRRINDGMGKNVAARVIKEMIKKDVKIQGAKVLVMGITFKENCADVRNTRVVDIIHEMKDFGCNIDVCDPWPDNEEVVREYQIELKDFAVAAKNLESYGAIVIAVAHKQFLELDFPSSVPVIFDVKNILAKSLATNLVRF